MTPRKITILRTEYIKEKHLIMWEVTYADPDDSDYGKKITLAYRANDLAAAVLGRPDIQITEENARVFNKEINGKTINIVDIPDTVDPNSVVHGDIDSLLDYSFKMKEYPFEEIYDIISNSE